MLVDLQLSELPTGTFNLITRTLFSHGICPKRASCGAQIQPLDLTNLLLPATRPGNTDGRGHGPASTRSQWPAGRFRSHLVTQFGQRQTVRVHCSAPGAVTHARLREHMFGRARCRRAHLGAFMHGRCQCAAGFCNAGVQVRVAWARQVTGP